MAPRKESASWSTSSTELLRIGRVGRPHGGDGGFKVADSTHRTELLDPGREVLVGERRLSIAARRGTPEHPIVVLDGVTDRGAAEALRGAPIAVPRAALGALGEGEYLVDDLIGCAVVDGARPVGRVRDVLLLPSADTLEVERPGEDPLLVPLVRDAVRGIDAGARRIDVDTGFLEPEGAP
jgi:16S rRNA processing protein RimM